MCKIPAIAVEAAGTVGVTCTAAGGRPSPAVDQIKRFRGNSVRRNIVAVVKA